jgi:hypothetical protein
MRDAGFSRLAQKAQTRGASVGLTGNGKDRREAVFLFVAVHESAFDPIKTLTGEGSTSRGNEGASLG